MKKCEICDNLRLENLVILGRNICAECETKLLSVSDEEYGQCVCALSRELAPLMVD